MIDGDLSGYCPDMAMSPCRRAFEGAPLSFWRVSGEFNSLVVGSVHGVAQAGRAWRSAWIFLGFNRPSTGWLAGENIAAILEPLGIEACQATIRASSRSQRRRVAANKGGPIKVLHRNEARCNGVSMVT